jgi:hypothetical protein
MLPVIAANDNLTIVGQGGDTISGANAGRLFDVATGATLTLSNLTLSNCFAIGGGAIYNQGTVLLNSVNVLSNGSSVAGGGIWSSGSLTLENGTLVQAKGKPGHTLPGASYPAKGCVTKDDGKGKPGHTLPGASYPAKGYVTKDDGKGKPGHTLPGASYRAKGYFTKGGNGYGGGLYAAAGATVTLRSDTVESNTAAGGSGKQNGYGYGGGLFIDTHATVYLDAATLANILNNAANKYPNIDGSYVLQS